MTTFFLLATTMAASTMFKLNDGKNQFAITNCFPVRNRSNLSRKFN